MSVLEARDGAVQNGGLEPPATFIHPSTRKHYDNSVTVEEYFHYAKLTRAEEDQEWKNPNRVSSSLWRQITRRGSKHQSQSEMNAVQEKIDKQPSDGHGSDVSDQGYAVITNEEWKNAARALRTASWGAATVIIVTDVLGPYGVGFAMGTLGWVPGIILYTVFGFLAWYSAILLWQVQMGLDSHEYPVRNYGDLVFRLFGRVPRYIVNILQSIQLLLIVGQVILLNGQGISQTSQFKLCYAVCVLLFVIAGFAVGQVRTLRNFGSLSLLAVCINLLVIFISMAVMAHSPPNFAIGILGSSGSAVDPTTITPDDQGNYPPIRHYTNLPNPNSLLGSVNGLLNGIFAYGGAQIYPEVVNEMAHPWDFIKSLTIANVFIWVVYLVYGLYVYGLQGQYAFQISYIGLSPYWANVVCDMLAVISGLIAAALYGNIGIKVLYNNVFMELFKAPGLNTKAGKYIFAATVPVYWAIAFVISGAIPDYFGFVSVIAAFCIIQFSYSFPPILHLAYYMHKNAIRPVEGFDGRTGLTRREDNGMKRWIRGFFARRWYWNVFNLIYALGALATAGLGAYAAIEGMIEAFQNPQINSFTCTSPLNLNP